VTTQRVPTTAFAHRPDELLTQQAALPVPPTLVAPLQGVSVAAFSEATLDAFETACASFAVGDIISATWCDRPGCDDYDPTPVTWVGRRRAPTRRQQGVSVRAPLGDVVRQLVVNIASACLLVC
jgi:hypothetical protein